MPEHMMGNKTEEEFIDGKVLENLYLREEQCQRRKCLLLLTYFSIQVKYFYVISYFFAGF